MGKPKSDSMIAAARKYLRTNYIEELKMMGVLLADEAKSGGKYTGVLFMPMETGGEELGKYVVRGISAGVNHINLPVRRERRTGMVTSPSFYDVSMAIKQLDNKVMGVFFDDVVSTGLDLCIMDAFGRAYNGRGEKPTLIEPVVFTTYLDNTGICDYRCQSPRGQKIYRKTAARERERLINIFRSEGKIPAQSRIIETLHTPASFSPDINPRELGMEGLTERWEGC